MNQQVKYFLFSVILIGSVFSCKKTSEPLFHREYFGLQEGRYVIYDVIEINHDAALLQHDTLIYQLKTYWGDTIIDNEGRIAREYYRFKRNLPSDPWIVVDLWTGIIDGVRAELIEENQRVVKLVFAPTLSKNWDGNAYNMLAEMDCYYRDIHQNSSVNGINFDSTLIVEQQDFTSLIDTVRMYELYAKNIGLIHKYSRDNSYQFFSPEVILGKEIFMDFVSTGFE